MSDENNLMKSSLAGKETHGNWSLPEWITQVGLCSVTWPVRGGDTASLSLAWAPIADLSRWEQRVEQS